MILLIFLVIMLVVLGIAAFFHAIALWLAAKMVEEDKGFKHAFATSIVTIIVGTLCMFIPIPILNLLIAIIAELLIIKVFYDTSWGKAIFIWIISVIVLLVIVFVLLFLVFGITVVLMLLGGLFG